MGEKVVVMPYDHAVEILAGLIQEDQLKGIRELYIQAHESSLYTDSLQVGQMQVMQQELNQQSYYLTLKSQELGLAKREIKVLKKRLRRAKWARVGHWGLTISLGGLIIYDKFIKK